MNTFAYFSYKGGSGRSSLAYNTIPLLAKKLNATRQKPLVVFDMDIDSAGLTFLFAKKNKSAKVYTQNIISGTYPGQYELADDIEEHSFFQSLVGIGDVYGFDERSILFLPARTSGEISVEQISNSYYIDGNPFEDIKMMCEEFNCCGLIFDCPTGSQMTAEVSLRLANKLITVMRITLQFRQGTYSYLSRFDESKANKEIIIVPNAVPRDNIVLDDIPYNYEAVKAEIKQSISDVIKNNKLNFGMLENDRFGVPEVVRFKFREDVLYNMEKLTEDERKALDMYITFADVVCG